MPYASGETPAVGDYIKNKWGQRGTVSRVHEARDGHEDISVRGDDGGTDPLAPAGQGLYVDFKAGLAGLLTFFNSSSAISFLKSHSLLCRLPTYDGFFRKCAVFHVHDSL